MNDGISVVLAGTASLLAILGAAPFADWHSLVTDFGFPIALVMFFVWNSWKREERLATRITNLEEFQQKDLLDLNRQAVQAIADNTAALSQLVSALQNRPCLCEAATLSDKIDTLADRIGAMANPGAT